MEIESKNSAKGSRVYYTLHFKKRTENYFCSTPPKKDEEGKYIEPERNPEDRPIINFEYFFMTNDEIPSGKFKEIENAIAIIMNPNLKDAIK